jgi:hypothetical protein
MQPIRSLSAESASHSTLFFSHNKSANSSFCHDRYIKDSYTCESTSSMCVQAQHVPTYLALSLDHHKNQSIKPVGSYIQAYNSPTPMPGSGRTNGRECYLQPTNSAQWETDDPLTLVILCLWENFIWGDIFSPLNIGGWKPTSLPSAFSFRPAIGSNLVQAQKE